MDCREFREILDLYVDGELSAEASTAARVHCSECSRCRSVEQELQRLRRELKQVVARHEPPPELIESVRDLSQSRLGKFLGAVAAKSKSIGPPLWKKSVAVPVPVFALFLLIAGSLAILALRLYGIRELRPDTAAPNKVQRPKPMTSQAGEGDLDLSRFDHGGRASLYKVSQ